MLLSRAIHRPAWAADLLQYFDYTPLVAATGALYPVYPFNLLLDTGDFARSNDFSRSKQSD